MTLQAFPLQLQIVLAVDAVFPLGLNLLLFV
jgi:hypothetical protein